MGSRAGIWASPADLSPAAASVLEHYFASRTARFPAHPTVSASRLTALLLLRASGHIFWLVVLYFCFRFAQGRQDASGVLQRTGRHEDSRGTLLRLGTSGVPGEVAGCRSIS